MYEILAFGFINDAKSYLPLAFVPRLFSRHHYLLSQHHRAEAWEVGHMTLISY